MLIRCHETSQRIAPSNRRPTVDKFITLRESALLEHTVDIQLSMIFSLSGGTISIAISPGRMCDLLHKVAFDREQGALCCP